MTNTEGSMVPRIQTRGCCVVAVAAWLWSGTAGAQPADPTTQKAAATKVKPSSGEPDRESHGLVVAECRPGDIVEDQDRIPVPSRQVSTLRVSGGITKAKTKAPRTTAEVIRTRDLLMVQPRGKAQPGTEFDVVLNRPHLPSVSLNFLVVPDEPSLPRQFIVMEAEEWDRQRREDRRRSAREEERIRRAERLELLREQARRMNQGEGVVLQPDTKVATNSHAPITVCVVSAQRSETLPDEYALISAEVTGRDASRPFRFGPVEVSDKLTHRPLSVEVIGLEGRDSLTAGEVVKLTLIVKLNKPGAVPPISLLFRQPNDEQPPVEADVGKWLIPVTQNEIDEEKRLERERERNRTLAKRTWLHVYGFRGVIWLEDGFDACRDNGSCTGPDKALDATSFTGFGVRVSKGLMAPSEGSIPLLAYEVDVVGATSGTAAFGEGMFQGDIGAVTRSARVIRVQAGAVLRSGEKVIPTLRGGVVVQGVSHDTELATMAGGVPGPEGTVEVTLGAQLGGSVDIRFREGFVAGIGVVFVQAGERRSIEGGLSLSFGL